jgi:hypothetical protein
MFATQNKKAKKRKSKFNLSGNRMTAWFRQFSQRRPGQSPVADVL